MAVVMTANNMGQTITLFDSSAGPLPIYGKKSTLELNQPGSFEFTLVIGHPAYQNLKEFVTYVKVVQDGEELFYGRVLSVQPSPMEGQEIVTCEGALSFLNDGELHKDEQNPNDSSAPEHQTMTAGAFLQRCLDAYNREIGDDPRRALGMGTVSHSKVNEEKEYEVTSYIKVKNAIEQFLLDDYGGFVRVRPDGRGGHCLDWMEDTNQRNNAAIQLGENVIDVKHTFSADGIFTAVRAIGNDDLKLPGSEVRDVYDGDQMREYGRIVHTIQFDTDDQSELESKVEDLIECITKTSYISSDIKLVDMHLIDGSRPSVKLGDQFTNIIGLEGIEMTVQTRTYDFDNPQNDSCTLKNSKEFDTDYSNKASAGSTGSSLSGQTSSNASQSWKYYSEVGDAAIINAKNIQLLGDLVEIHAKQLVTTANEIVTLSRRSGDLEENVATMNGTGVMQNSDMITQVAGIFGYGWRLVPQSVLDKPGLNPSEEGYYNAHQITTTAADIGSGRELYASLTDILTGNRVDTKTIRAGQYYYELTESTDTAVVRNKNYYYRTLSVNRGTEIFMDDSGQEVTVKSTIKKIEGNVTTIEGSALWTKRDFITGVVGEFDVVVDPVTGEKTLVIQSGGGMKIERDGTAFGLFDEGNLTGGIITEKLTDGTVSTLISGNIVNLNANNGYTQLVADKNGIQATVQDHATTISTHTRRIGDIEYEVSSMQGTALWQNRNDIAAVAGEFDVITYGDGSKKLVVKSGGGLKIQRNGTEFGLYDDGNLTAGVIVNKINGGTTKIEAKNIVLSGNTTLNDIFVVDGYGIHALRKFYGTSMELSGGLDTGSVEFTGYGNTSYNMTSATVAGMIKSASVSGNVLTLTKFDDTTINFSKATTLSGAWSSSNGKQYVVTASPQGSTHTLTLNSRLNGTAQYNNFSAEVGIPSGSSLTVNSNLTVRGYLVETVSGASSYVDVKSGSTSGTVVARISTTATYNAGRNAVGIGSVVWEDVSSIGVDRYFKVSTTGKDTNSSVRKRLYLTATTTWSNGVKTVQLRDGGTTGTIVAEREVSASGITCEHSWADVSQITSSRWCHINASGSTTRTHSFYLLLTASGNTVQLRDGGSSGTVVAEKTVSGSIPDLVFVWGTVSQIESSRWLYVRASGTTTNLKSTALYLTASGNTVQLREGGTSGTVVAEKAVSTSVPDLTFVWSTASQVGSNRTLYVRASGTTTNLKSMSLYLTASGNTVQLREGSTSGTVIAENTISSSTAGVTFVWSSSTQVGDSRTLYARANGTTTNLASKNLYLTASGNTVYLRDGSTSGNVIAEKAVPSDYDTGFDEGFDVGYAAGDTVGYSRGYTAGYVDGTNSATKPYSISTVGAGTCPEGSVNTTLNGWNPKRLNIDLPGPQNYYYRYIYFKVDGVTRSFYFV